MADRLGPAVAALQLSCRGNPMRERILRDWVAFSESRGELAALQSLPRTPKGAAIDWIRLYEEVVAKGGFQHTTRNKLWAAIASRECLNIDIMPYVLASYYERYLLAFEEKQLFGRDVPSLGAGTKRPAPDAATTTIEPIATTTELQEAQNVRGTQLPNPPKRLKVRRQEQSDLGTLHGLVLALDSQIDSEVTKAINLLNVLSYGNYNALHGESPLHALHAPVDGENDIVIDNVPGLLDALYRQLQSCQLLPQVSHEAPAARVRRELLNMGEEVGKRELLDTKALMVLNIVRNLSMVAENEKPLADHEDLVVFLILVLRRIELNHEIGDHVLDILCNIAKRIDFLGLHPPSKIELWHPDYNLSSHLWKKERVLPLECLLQQLKAMLLNPNQRRSIVLRVCELLCNATRDVALRPMLAKSPSLCSDELVDRMVGLLACSRQDFMHVNISTRRRQGGISHDGDYNMDSDEDDDANDEPEDESTKWPAPWESDGLPSGVGMGIVYVTPEGNRNAQSGTGVDDDLKVDHEMRDAALEVLYRLADRDDRSKLQLARHPNFLARVAGILTSCIGRPEAARIAVAVLSCISMDRETFPYFLPIEKDLILLAFSDRSVSDILNNVVADVFGMHAL